MICNRCKKEIPDNANYCPFCTMPQTNFQMPQQVMPNHEPAHLSPAVPPTQKAKKKLKWWHIAIIVVAFFGVMNLIVTLLDPVITTALNSVSNTTESNSKSSSAQSKASVVSIDPRAAVRKSGNFSLLVSKGLSEKQADAYIDAAAACGLGKPVEVLFFNKGENDTYVGNIKVNDGDFVLNLTVRYAGDRITIIKDNADIALYSEGKVNKEYLFWKDVSTSQIKTNATENIKKILKAPSTAKFPGGFLDPYEGWGFAKSDKYYIVESYVDSQNSFGAMLRSDFRIEYKKTESGGLSIVYLVFDGEVVFNSK